MRFEQGFIQTYVSYIWYTYIYIIHQRLSLLINMISQKCLYGDLASVKRVNADSTTQIKLGTYKAECNEWKMAAWNGLHEFKFKLQKLCINHSRANMGMSGTIMYHFSKAVDAIAACGTKITTVIFLGGKFQISLRFSVTKLLQWYDMSIAPSHFTANTYICSTAYLG